MKLEGVIKHATFTPRKMYPKSSGLTLEDRVMTKSYFHASFRQVWKELPFSLWHKYKTNCKPKLSAIITNTRPTLNLHSVPSKSWDSPANLFKSTKVLMATPVTQQGSHLGYNTHTRARLELRTSGFSTLLINYSGEYYYYLLLPLLPITSHCQPPILQIQDTMIEQKQVTCKQINTQFREREREGGREGERESAYSAV